MTSFSAISTKIQYWLQFHKNLSLKGVTPNQWCLLAGNYFANQLFNSTHLFVCSETDEAEEVFECLKHLKNVYFYPGHNHGLYTSVLTSERSMIQRWGVLQKIMEGEPCLVVTTYDASLLLGPDEKFFKENIFYVSKDDIISPFDLSKKLTQLGYFSTSTVEEPGTFSRRGEIFDIYPISHPPIRLHYFDDLIEDIFEIDSETQKTNREKIYTKVSLIPGAGILTRENFSSNLRSALPQPQPVFKNKFETRKQILN